jgi:hypothetical protein
MEALPDHRRTIDDPFGWWGSKGDSGCLLAGARSGRVIRYIPVSRSASASLLPCPAGSAAWNRFHVTTVSSRRRFPMKAVILAGGLGTRISEETHLKPKPMIEIGGRPILWHVMKLWSIRVFCG